MAFIEKNNLGPYLFASKSFNPQTGEILIDNSKFDVENNSWVQSNGIFKTKAPTND